MSRWSRCLGGVAVLSVAVLAGCAQPEPEAAASAPATVSGTGTVAPPVTVTVSADRHRAGDVIVLTVVNGGAAPLYADDLRTDCSPVLLERREGGTWTRYDNCGVERASAVVTWAPGERREIRLDTAGSNFSTPPLLAGVHRIAFGFRRSSTPEGVVTEWAHSSEFRIG
ncbi:hypothetical protein ACPFP2_07730 [Micromonospora citrea]|uniref:hypothetical protein n=1 Tax=Micromonospora citrea TaxID=47855 RepID=UPI003C3E2744